MYSSLQSTFSKIQLKLCVNPSFTTLRKQFLLKHSFHSCNAVTSNQFKTNEINTEHIRDLVQDSENIETNNIIINQLQAIISRQLPFPEFMTADHLQELCDLKTKTQRQKYLHYLFKREKMRLAEVEKKEKKRQERERRLAEKATELNNDVSQYGLGKNSLLISVRDKCMNKFYRKRLANSILFGEKIVLDLSYDPLMTEKEKKACVAQLKVLYSVNKEHLSPFDLYFCNANSSYKCVKYLKRDLLKLDESLITLTEKNYLDIFPREKLVYLSPHASETLKEFDHNAVYIIGAFVDTVKKEHVSSHKAETDGIKSYKLPLDDYVLWGSGTKSLTINQAFEIMLILKTTGDWKRAFEVIPARKIRRIECDQVDALNLSDKRFLLNTSKSKSD